MNARVGNCNKCDYIVNDRLIQDIDGEEYEPDKPIQRVLKDRVVDSHGRKLIELCKSSNIRIVNGRLYEDKGIGGFTFCNSLGSSVIDNVLTNNNNFDCISCFKVERLNEWSDHAPVTFDLNICKRTQCHNEVEQNQSFCVYKWNNENRELFRRVIIGNLPEFNNIVNSIDTTNKSSINKAVDQFSYEIQIAAEPLFAKTYKMCNDCKSQKVKQSKWFDEDCYIAKKNM